MPALMSEQCSVGNLGVFNYFSLFFIAKRLKKVHNIHYF